MKKKKKEITADELLMWLKDKRVITHTDRKFCLHNLSNTLIITCEGKVMTHHDY